MMPTPGQRDLAALQHTLATTGDDARVRRLTSLEAVWKGLRYELEARPSFWDKSVPLRERAPCVVYELPRSAGARVIALVFGEGRFPSIKLSDAVPEAQRAALAALIVHIVRAAKLRPRMRQVLEQGLSTGSACLVCSIREGHLCATVLPAKWCAPVLDDRGRVESLDVRHKFLGDDGKLYWYRRTIDAQADTVYAPTLVDDKRIPSVPTESYPQTFCPVVWTRNEADPTAGGVDGEAMFAGLEDELEALDFSLSQRHRNAQYNGEPLTVRVLGEQDEDASDGMTVAQGREADPKAGAFAWSKSAYAFLRDAVSGRPAAKKEPGSIVTLSKGGDMKLVESSGAGAVILTGDADDLRRKILETVGVVMADPETVSANASAALQKALYAPMLARCDGLREEYGDTLCLVVETYLRLLCSPAVRDATVHLPGWRELVPTLDALFAQGGVPMELAWGEYFDPTPADVQAGVTAMSAAAGGGQVVSKRRAVEYLATLLGTKDVDAELALIEADERGGADAAHSMLSALTPQGAPEVDAPAATDAPPADVPEAKDPQAALNGAQVSSLLEIVSQVALGAIPRETGVQILTAAFPLDEAAADKILGAVGRGFVPTTP